MTESTAYIRSKLVNYLEADCSDENVKNNRVHYRLRFESDRGWAWMEKQVDKLNRDLSVTLELYEICPSGVNDYEIDVREIERREGVDDDQIGLGTYES